MHGQQNIRISKKLLLLQLLGCPKHVKLVETVNKIIIVASNWLFILLLDYVLKRTLTGSYSPHRATQLYRVDSLHPPGHTLTAVMLRSAMKETRRIYKFV